MVQGLCEIFHSWGNPPMNDTSNFIKELGEAPCILLLLLLSCRVIIIRQLSRKGSITIHGIYWYLNYELINLWTVRNNLLLFKPLFMAFCYHNWIKCSCLLFFFCIYLCVEHWCSKAYVERKATSNNNMLPPGSILAKARSPSHVNSLLCLFILVLILFLSQSQMSLI